MKYVNPAVLLIGILLGAYGVVTHVRLTQLEASNAAIANEMNSHVLPEIQKRIEALEKKK